jgi:hypothetical protein
MPETNTTALPEWVKHTPEHEETEYSLQVYQHHAADQVAQEIAVTREEYEWLKDRLAESRGYEMPKKTAEPEEATPKAPDWITSTPDETAYDIAMYDTDGVSIENITINRHEYQTLKSVVACMRLIEDDKWLAVKTKINQAIVDEMLTFCDQFPLHLKRVSAMAEAFGHALTEED